MFNNITSINNIKVVIAEGEPALINIRTLTPIADWTTFEPVARKHAEVSNINPAVTMTQVEVNE